MTGNIRIWVSGMIILAMADFASAAVVDLTGGPGSSGVVNGARFDFWTSQPAGTGVFKPFVRIQMNGNEAGYNTSAATLPFDEKAGIWTHDVQLGSIPVVSVGGVNYLEFRLDINESRSTNNRLLSLDDIQIYTSSVGSKNSLDLASLGVLRYSMDAGADSHVLLDYSLASGSGEADMRALIPFGNFQSASPNDYMYFYSAFGSVHSASAGFEEWSVVPEPSSLGLLAAGLLPLFRRRRTT